MHKFYWLFILLMACNGAKENSNTITIRGDLEGFGTGYIYLTGTDGESFVKDSIPVKDGKFLYSRKVDSSFVPGIAFLMFHIKGASGPSGRYLEFRNPYIQQTNVQFFYWDKGETVISGKFRPASESELTLTGSKQNEPLFRQLQLSGFSGDDNEENRKAIIEKDRAIIAAHPFSLYLADVLFRNRGNYTPEELKVLLSAFGSPVLGSSGHQRIDRYIEREATSPVSVRNLMLDAFDGAQLPMLDSQATVNMVVFWASWCGPCRAEIPMLKDLYKEYAAKGVAFTNVSVDKQIDAWKLAVEQEKMPWRQLRVGDSTDLLVESQYTASSIPIVYFVGKSGRIIDMVSGQASQPQFHQVIKRCLKRAGL